MRSLALTHNRIVAASVAGIVLLVLAAVLAAYEGGPAEAADPVLVGAGDIANCSKVSCAVGSTQE